MPYTGDIPIYRVSPTDHYVTTSDQMGYIMGSLWVHHEVHIGSLAMMRSSIWTHIWYLHGDHGVVSTTCTTITTPLLIPLRGQQGTSLVIRVLVMVHHEWPSGPLWYSVRYMMWVSSHDGPYGSDHQTPNMDHIWWLHGDHGHSTTPHTTYHYTTTDTIEGTTRHITSEQCVSDGTLSVIGWYIMGPLWYS
jgi:hypothetical protein